LDIVAHSAEEPVDLLVAGVAGAFGRLTAVDSTVVELDCDGRAGVVADHDFTATVGPLTATFPLAVRVERTEPAGARVRAVHAGRLAVPSGGLRYGALRGRLDAPPDGSIGVRYLGRTDGESAMFRAQTVRPVANRYPLDVVGVVTAGRLQISVACDRWPDTDVSRFAVDVVDEIGAAVDQIAGESPAEPAVTRYPMSGLDQEQLDALLTGILSEGGHRR
jgi:hypothetical protein